MGKIVRQGITALNSSSPLELFRYSDTGNHKHDYLRKGQYFMRIEISEKGSEAFYREVVNISAQYRSILKNHHHKLKDYFKQFTVLLILGAVFFALLVLMAVFWGIDPWGYAIIAALSITAAMCAVYLHLLNKMLRAMLADSRFIGNILR